MFLIKYDGEATAVTNTFDSAALYADGIRQPGHRITIVAMQPGDWGDALRALERRETSWSDTKTLDEACLFRGKAATPSSVPGTSLALR